MADELPPLTLQPLVENSILHAVAAQGRRPVTISARRNALNHGLDLAVADDGPADPEALAPPGQRRGVGLAALKKRFALDYGQARLHPSGSGRGLPRRPLHSSDMSATTVLIAEDEPCRRGLADWVKATPGLQLVAVCEDGEDASPRSAHSSPPWC
jgi:hypothetical protein